MQPDPLLRAASAGGGAIAFEGDLHLHIDGASRGNPGQAAWGVFVSRPDGTEVARLKGAIGRATNNVAEYQALLHGLRFALEQGARRVQVFSDSELVVKQLDGRYRVRHPAMLPLHAEARALLLRFESARVTHVRRELNKEADRLANEALDGS